MATGKHIASANQATIDALKSKLNITDDDLSSYAKKGGSTKTLKEVEDASIVISKAVSRLSNLQINKSYIPTGITWTAGYFLRENGNIQGGIGYAASDFIPVRAGVYKNIGSGAGTGITKNVVYNENKTVINAYALTDDIVVNEDGYVRISVDLAQGSVNVNLTLVDFIGSIYALEDLNNNKMIAIGKSIIKNYNPLYSFKSWVNEETVTPTHSVYSAYIVASSKDVLEVFGISVKPMQIIIDDGVNFTTFDYKLNDEYIRAIGGIPITGVNYLPSSFNTDTYATNTNWTINVFIKNDGSLGSGTGYAVSDFIPVMAGRYKNIGTGEGVPTTHINIYNKNKGLMSTVRPLNTELFVPFDGYIKLTVTGQDIKNVNLTAISALVETTLIERLNVNSSSSNNEVINNNVNESHKLPSGSKVINNLGVEQSDFSNYGEDNFALKIPLKGLINANKFYLSCKVRINDNVNKDYADINYDANLDVHPLVTLAKDNSNFIKFGIHPKAPAPFTTAYPTEGVNTTWAKIWGRAKVGSCNALGVNNNLRSSEPLNGYENNMIVGEEAFSVRYIGDLATLVYCENKNGFFRIWENEGSDIVNINLSSVDLRGLIEALKLKTELEVDFYTIHERTTSDLLEFSAIPLVTDIVTKSYDGVGEDGISVDSHPLFVKFKIDKTFHDVEIMYDSTIDATNVYFAFDGFTLRSAPASNVLGVNSFVIFGGGVDGINLKQTVKDINIRIDNMGDAELSKTGSGEPHIVSNISPSIIPVMWHTTVDKIEGDPSMVTADVSIGQTYAINKAIQDKGYVHLGAFDFEKVINGQNIGVKRGYINVYDDFRFEIYGWKRLRSIFLELGIKPSMALLTNRFVVTSELGYTIEDVVQWSKNNGWIHMNHTSKHYDLSGFHYEDLKDKLQESIADGQAMGIAETHLVYPFGGASPMTVDVVRHEGFAFGLDINRRFGKWSKLKNKYKITRTSVGGAASTATNVIKDFI